MKGLTNQGGTNKAVDLIGRVWRGLLFGVMLILAGQFLKETYAVAEIVKSGLMDEAVEFLVFMNQYYMLLGFLGVCFGLLMIDARLYELREINDGL